MTVEPFVHGLATGALLCATLILYREKQSVLSILYGIVSLAMVVDGLNALGVF